MRMGKGSASEDARSTAIQGYGPEASWEVSFTDAQIKFHVRLASHPAAHMHPKLNRGGTRVVFASNRDGDFEIYSIAAGIQSIGVYHNDFAALAHENRHVQPGMVYEPYLLGGTSALTNGNLEAGLSGWTAAGGQRRQLPRRAGGSGAVHFRHHDCRLADRPDQSKRPG